MRTSLKLSTLVFVGAILTAGCSGGRTGATNFEYFPGLSMMDQKSLKAQDQESFFANNSVNQLPPEGTIARGQHTYQFSKEDSAESVGAQLKNPLPRTPEILARGQKMYDTHCIVCHGPKGKSDGYVVPKFPMPPTLHSDKVRGWADGAIYHVITVGQNIMPPYASQIDPEDRWAIVHYIRVLQTAVNP